MKITEFKIGDEIQTQAEASRGTYTWKLVELTSTSYQALFKPNHHNKNDYDNRAYIHINLDSTEEFILINEPKPEVFVYQSRLNLIQYD
jgi:hypothetical protein